MAPPKTDRPQEAAVGDDTILPVQQVLSTEQARLAVIGLGYVGLPLAVNFDKVMPTVGYDVDPGRIADLSFSCDPQAIAGCIRAFGKADCVVYDVNGVLPREAIDGRLYVQHNNGNQYESTYHWRRGIHRERAGPAPAGTRRRSRRHRQSQ